MQRITLILLIILSLVGCKSEEKEEVQKTCFENSNAISLEHNGIEREYILYVPESYNSSNPTPMFLNFHGFGGSASDFMAQTNMTGLAEDNSFILVYPQGSCIGDFSHWNACPPSIDNKSPADDFGFIETMINDISSEYNIDMERIYAAGYSNGGMMAFGLANHKSNLVAAVGSVSGAMLDCNGPTSHPMPVITLHGTNDFVLPYNGNSEYASAESTIDYWVDFNNTNNTPIVNSEYVNGVTIEHYLYNEGDNNVAVEHYKYIGGEHVWFRRKYQNKNASELVWDFVSKYDINGLR